VTTRLEAVRAKFREIHADLEANVTHIYERADLITAFDLVMHSALQFYFQGDLLRRGWVEGLVVGDTRCGKSESVSALVHHYRAGEIVTGENTSFAGLLGGMQQTQKAWSICWGKYPLNDRRALTVDEASGLKQEDIAHMSGVRSSGIAEIVKIQTEKTVARVRSLWLSNPRGKRPLAAFNSGFDAVMDLIGQPEDVARFDFAMTVASAEVPLEVINARTRPRVPHVYTAAMCRRLLHYAWSRRANQIELTPQATEACLSHATEMSRRYVPPLVEGAEQRVKLARLAVACAARLFSTSPDGLRVVVLPEHVEYVVEFLDAVYTKRSMSFHVYSKARMGDRELAEADEVQAELDKRGQRFVELLSETSFFRASTLQDFAACDREEAAKLCAFLVRHRCAKEGRHGYYKLPAFIEFLRAYRPGAARREPGADDGPESANRGPDEPAPF
jgi:hypothetical protein